MAQSPQKAVTLGDLVSDRPGAPVIGDFLQLLSTRGVGQGLEMNTLPFFQEQLSTKDCWEIVAKEPVPLLL